MDVLKVVCIFGRLECVCDILVLSLELFIFIKFGMSFWIYGINGVCMFYVCKGWGLW